jgi:2'-5' RNA ligase
MPDPDTVKELRRRVFFAIWPDEKTRRALTRATHSVVRRCGGRAISPSNLHVTLAFIGSVTETFLMHIQQIPPFASPGFELVFDRLGFWSDSRVLWTSPSQVPTALIELESVLWNRLVEIGFERQRSPYRPHVTLARKARFIEESISPVNWSVSGLALVESKIDSRYPTYEVIGAWPFGTDPE